MSAPSIPNLATLRRGGPRLRGRSGPPSINSSTTDEPPTTNSRKATDTVIQSTDLDASTSRLSAISAGYLEDPFAHLLYEPLAPNTPPPRRLPLMNRGTYVRTVALDRIVDVFLRSYPGRRKQIVSLGAGSDTRYWRLLREWQLRRRRGTGEVKGLDEHGLVYHELDFEENTKMKVRRLKSRDFKEVVERECGQEWGVEDTGNEGGASRILSKDGGYTLSPLDLRTLKSPQAASDIAQTMSQESTNPPPTNQTETAPSKHTLPPNPPQYQPPTTSTNPTPQIDPSLPTLLLAEMSLCYLPVPLAHSAIKYFTTLLPTSTSLAISLYEPLHPTSPFGQTMTRNLLARGITLPTVAAYPDLPAQKRRLMEAGFTSGQGGKTVRGCWEEWVEERERRRVEGLEWMDEVEEWVVMGGQWGVVWGWREEGEEDSGKWAELGS